MKKYIFILMPLLNPINSRAQMSPFLRASYGIFKLIGSIPFAMLTAEYGMRLHPGLKAVLGGCTCYLIFSGGKDVKKAISDYKKSNEHKPQHTTQNNQSDYLKRNGNEECESGNAPYGNDDINSNASHIAKSNSCS